MVSASRVVLTMESVDLQNSVILTHILVFQVQGVVQIVLLVITILLQTMIMEPVIFVLLLVSALMEFVMVALLQER